MLLGAVLPLDRRPATLPRAAAQRRARPWRGSTATATCDGDGFVEYQRALAGGLVNQGWKDSRDAIVHADGTLAEPPDRAGRGAGLRLRWPSRAWPSVFDALGDAGPGGRAARARRPSCATASTSAFWMEDERFYAHGARRRQAPGARRVTSNAGHGLYCGIVDAGHGRRAWPRRLLAPDMFSGWGIRTLCKRAAALQPDELPQRLGLAARQRAHRGGPEALRASRRRADADRARRMFEAAVHFADYAPARAVLRLRPRRSPTGRWPTRSPARRRRGPPARRSCSCRRCSGSPPHAPANT